MIARLLCLCAIVSSGCTCGVALCGDDSDCGPGGSCDLDTNVCVIDIAIDGGTGGGSGGGVGGGAGGGASSTLLVVRTPAVPARPSMGGTAYADSPAAWLRSDVVYIWLEASRPLTNPVLDVAGVTAVPAAPASCAEACAANCYCFAADLSKPELAGLRGSFALSASGIDPDGKATSATGSLNVTRLFWRRPLGQAIRATPAIGADGTVYVGTSSGASRVGSVVAISAAGQERWTKVVGRVEASVLVAAPTTGPQRLFVGSVSNTGMLNAFDATGAQLGQCPLSKDHELEASPVAIPGGAAFFANKVRELIAFRPAVGACETRQEGEDVVYPDSLVGSGASVFYVDNKPSVHRFDLGGSGWAEYSASQWPGMPFSSYRNRGLSVSGGKLIGSGEMMMGGTVFQAPISGSFKFDFGFSPPRVAGWARGPVVASDGLVLVGIPTGIAAVSATSTQVGLGDRILNTPALGQGGRLYALAENGSLSEWTYVSAKPARTWTAALEAPGSFDASPALDCARTTVGIPIAGRPGILYAASRAGTLHAIIVDARGIDATAQWPKYQKDPRNSGSADTGLQEFACP